MTPLYRLKSNYENSRDWWSIPVDTERGKGSCQRKKQSGKHKQKHIHQDRHCKRIKIPLTLLFFVFTGGDARSDDTCVLRNIGRNRVTSSYTRAQKPESHHPQDNFKYCQQAAVRNAMRRRMRLSVAGVPCPMRCSRMS